MSATLNPTDTAVDAVDIDIDIDNDVKLIAEQIKALKELALEDDEEPISEGQRYDFSIRWGTVLAGRLRRLVHYGSLDRLSDADVRRFRALCDELRTLSHLIDRFRLAQLNFTDAPPATARPGRPPKYSRR
jgi:hypothetical protein